MINDGYFIIDVIACMVEANVPRRDFFHLRLVRPEFDDSLMDLILEMDRQRKFVLGGTRPPQLLFRLMSSLA